MRPGRKDRATIAESQANRFPLASVFGILVAVVAVGCAQPMYQHRAPLQNLWRIALDTLTLIGSFPSLDECADRGRALMAQRSKNDFREYICLDATWRPKEH